MKRRRKSKVIYLQISAAIVSLMLGLFNLGKESSPIMQKIKTTYQQNIALKQQEQALKKANEISQMQIQWHYKSNDGVWRYYSDESNRYWCRVNIQGIYEYSENPNYRQSYIASNASLMR